MERIIASNLTQHFNDHQILYELQHGFRLKRSCETQLIQRIEDLSRQLIQDIQVDLVLRDFSKAFDKVSHLKLLFKLSQHGIRGKTLRWIRSFFVGRTQAVVLERETSEKVPVNLWVPKGSVLEPLLFFTVHQWSSRRWDSLLTIQRFVLLSEIPVTPIYSKLIWTLEIWERTWDMEFQPSKCQVLYIKVPRIIPVQTAWSDLGVRRQCQISWCAYQQGSHLEHTWR